jgi:hypothetical protein
LARAAVFVVVGSAVGDADGCGHWSVRVLPWSVPRMFPFDGERGGQGSYRLDLVVVCIYILWGGKYSNFASVVGDCAPDYARSSFEECT